MVKEECKGIWVFAEQENGVLSGTDFAPAQFALNS